MKFDTIVVTAANAAQARGYRAQTKGRGNVLVIADPGGRRVGSLGATVNLLKKLKLGKRVLVCHSGGDARRTPGYAAMGKAFTPLKDGRPLFDHIVESMERLPIPSTGGLLVASGDVLLDFDFGKVDFSRPGVTGVAYPDGPFQARRHGVYIEKGGAVVDFLQKPDVSRGKFLIDTGILFIDWKTARKMRSLPVSGDIYEEFPKMLLAGFAPFSVCTMDTCTFFHIGSSRELLKLLGDGKTYVDSVHCELELAGGNVVTNVPPGRFKKLSLGKNECFTCLPVGKDGWYDLKYMLDDNFKTDGLWEKHGLAEKMAKIDHGRLLAIRDCRRASAVRVTAPVRIDFAGGWSDTPPICNVEGGTVLNAAVLLDGERPVEVVVRPREDRFVRIVSKDLGKNRVLKSAAEIADHSDPHDWCALVKSALAVTGFRFGDRGLDITISANLPKGSGMGTSSILGAATIAALLGRVDVDEIGELTLRLEQEMHTGGGWQDQFGGLVGGVKLLSSSPGARQRIRVSPVKIPEPVLSDLKSRALLFFTGQKRMARNILRKVLSFYADNPHNFAKILVDSLKDDAECAAAALANGDMKRFAASVNGYWRDKKLLDPGSTNDRVEEMIEFIKPWTQAVTLTGAGGGGFMFILAKRPSDVPKIRKALESMKESRLSRFYPFDIDSEGLKLEML
ncbi:MAG: hypothetical protein K6F50_03555 [Kiritimatiellae bacterium]|nr:hypothetical protein [Kiritimatiellia bacterium]